MRRASKTKGDIPLGSLTPCVRLAAVLAPDLLYALNEFVAERVSAELAAVGTTCTNGPRWLSFDRGRL